LCATTYKVDGKALAKLRTKGDEEACLKACALLFPNTRACQLVRVEEKDQARSGGCWAIAHDTPKVLSQANHECWVHSKTCLASGACFDKAPGWCHFKYPNGVVGNHLETIVRLAPMLGAILFKDI
jgi:hypothetical protein